jgi:drug/metabolite transporter (DMT)-like permease
MTQSPKFTTYLQLFTVYIVWGSTFLGVRYALDELPPLMTSTLRFLVGGIILLIFNAFQNNPKPTAQQWRSALWVGVLLSGIGNCVVAYALGFMPTGFVALLTAMLPAWIVGLDYFFFSKQKPSNLTILGLITGLVGMVVLINPFQSLDTQTLSLWPSLLVLAGGFAWAWGSLQTAYLSMPPTITQTMAIQMLGGGIFALIASLCLEPNAIDAVLQMSAKTYWALAYLIFIGSFLGYSAYIWLLQNAPPSLTATYAYVNPVVAIVLGWWFLGETLSSQSIIASVIILIGVMLITIGRKVKGRG